MAYYRGDYYRGGRKVGDYYRGRSAGDPFWSALLKGIGTVAKAVIGIPAAAPTQAAAVSGSGSVGGLATMVGQSREQIGQAGARAVGALIPRPPSPMRPAAAELVPMAPGSSATGVFGGHRRYRRMNPANPKALRRAVRRIAGFGRLAASARTAVGKAATQLQARHRAHARSSRR